MIQLQTLAVTTKKAEFDCNREARNLFSKLKEIYLHIFPCFDHLRKSWNPIFEILPKMKRVEELWVSDINFP